MKNLFIFLVLVSLVFAAGSAGTGPGTGTGPANTNPCAPSNSNLDPNTGFFDSLANSLGCSMQDIPGVAGGPVGAATVGLKSVMDSLGTASCDDPFLSAGAQFPKEIVDTLWLAPTALILIIVFFGVACVYIVGQFMGSPQLIALAKEEAYQTTVTIRRVMIMAAVLVAGGLWFSFSAAHASADPIYSNTQLNPTMIDAAMSFSRMMVSEMSTDYSMLLLYNTVVHTIYSSTMWFGVTWRAMYSFNMGPILKPLIDVVGTSLQFLSLGISEWILHLVTLCIIKKWTWSLFFPMGILLRAFPFTRTAGEALICIAFCLAIVYPFMFLIDYEVHKIMQSDIVDAQSAMHSFISNSGLFNVFGAVLISMLLTAGVFIPFFLGGIVSLAFELVRGSVYYIVIMAILMPFFNIFITLTAARECARFFGTDVNFLGFLKLI